MKSRNFLSQCLWIGVVAGLLGIIDGQWEKVAAQEQIRIRDHFYAAHLFSADEGWAVGSFGAIYHTKDGGKSWEKQDSKVFEPLYGVRFVSATEGWVSGKSGLILHTTDGGKNWEKQLSGTTNHLFNLAFLDNQHGIAVGDFGSIIHTSDGGKTWNDVFKDTPEKKEDVFLYAVVMHESGKAWIAGERGTLLLSEDHGATWAKQETGTEASLLGLSFKDGTFGCAVGMDGTILQSEDAGKTWKAYESPVQTALYNVALDGNTGLAVGDEGVILTSSDAGKNWSLLDAPEELSLYWLMGLSITSGSSHALLTGANGLLLAADGTKVDFSRFKR
jgi:photosystem II stability/assembly factor-like uncharacterized protein